jgi:TolB-like protein/DNA-binding winged helix-turn-helix (wHTH) protein
VSPESQTRRKYHFGVFELDPLSGELYKHGIRVKLQDQPFQVLVVLLERPGEMVTREELRQRLWGHDTYVDFDHSLNISINKLRDALGDSATSPRFIETLPRRGYRFLAPVAVDQPVAIPSVTVAAVTAVAAEPAALQTETPSVKEEKAAGESRTPPVRGKPLLVATVAVLITLAIVLAVWLWPKPRVGTVSPQGRVMLAVLPFQDLTADQKEMYFITGLHDEMISQLGRLHPSRLGVIARTSVLQYASTHKPVDQIGRDLHVEYVLDGTVRMAGDHFRITAALIQVSDQTQLWTETYELKMGDMLSLQEDVSGRVAQALSVEFLPEAQQELRQSATANAEAYQAYLQGRYLWHQETHDSLEQAIKQFQKAIELDPNYAPAYVGLADSYNVLGGYGFVPPDDAFGKGKIAANKALELAPNLSDAHTSLAFASFYYDWDWSTAERQFKKAIALNPNNQIAHEFYSSFLHVMGRLDEAEAENRIAKELDPMDGWLYDDKGWMLLSRRKPEAAIPEFQKAIELNPKFPAAHLSLAVAYTRMGQYQQAFEEVRKAEQLRGDPTRVLEIMGSVQALSGDLAGAKATVDRLREGNIGGRVSPYSVALIYTAMGKKSDALDWLEKCYKDEDTWTVWIGVLVEWDSLRSEPRFVNLIHRLKLPF